jgi:hypothetical protein
MNAITNRFNLPAPLVEAVRNDGYSNSGTLSVTTLIKPPQAVAIERAHAAELTEDASDRIWALLGQATHTILERAAMGLGDEYVIEERFFATLEGVKVSGQCDILHKPTKTIQDYKVTSAYSAKSAIADGKDEWTLQLSMLAALARHSGHEVERGQIVAILKDWSRRTAEEEARKAASFGAACTYPQANVILIDIPLMSNDDTINWMRDRVKQFQRAFEGTPPPCTDEERWKQPGKAAVMKQGRKTALKLFDCPDEAAAFAASQVGAYVEHRPTKFNRCEAYCQAAQWCPQHQAFLKEQNNVRTAGTAAAPATV